MSAVSAPDNLMDEARGWLADCGINADGYSDTEILDVIHREYCGGVEGLVRDLLPGGA